MKRVAYLSGMENSVTITLEKYHSLLDSETELKELIKNGKIKVVDTDRTNFGSVSSVRISFIDDKESLVKQQNIIDYLQDDLENTSKRLNNFASDNIKQYKELEKIKKHWAYRWFIKKGD